MEEAIKSIEEKEGIRMTWNVFPSVKAESQKNVIPLVFLYTPLQGYHTRTLPRVNYAPIKCARTDCGGVLNPYSALDFGTRHWSCLFCGRMNMLPPHYRDISMENLPYEMFNENTTIFYKLVRPASYSRTYWFVIDLCSFDEERHLLLQEGLLTALEMIADTDSIGIIRYSANVEIVSLESSDVAQVHVFPAATYSSAIVQKVFSSYSQVPSSPLMRFTRRKNECVDHVKAIFKTLQINSFPVPAVERPKRCTGSAVQLASSIVQSTCAEGTGHIFLFTQGPCTVGPAAIASLSMKDSLRSNTKGIVNLFSKENIYHSIADALGRKGHVVDIIAAGIDDFGYSEMRPLTEKTGGIVVFARDFNPFIYKESIKRAFAPAPTEEDLLQVPLKRMFNARTTVKVSKGYAARNVIGHGTFQSEDRKTSLVWRASSLFDKTTDAIVFEHIEDAPANITAYVQISTRFTDSTGECFERITTLARSFADANSMQQVVSGFDQEAACVYKAKELCVNADNGDGVDVVRQADRCLIRFMQRFCIFERDSVSSIRTPPSIAFFPEFMFFLRRLPALHTDGLSLDEVAYQRTVLLEQSTQASTTIIRPTLISFHYSGQREPVELDSKSLMPDVALLVDTFHDVVIWRGENIVAWIKAGIEDKEEYWYFKEMLATLEKEANDLVNSRLPVPKLTVCDQYSSQERILLCKVNPSSSVANSVTGEGQTIVTEDIDFSRFYEYLIKLIVAA